MAAEFGHSVRIVEGYRSTERQNALFEQGRTQPGDVVTWTRASRHIDGLAADVIIDGSYDDKRPYQLLRRIADQEGLRTLPGDEGHLELPGRMAIDATRGTDRSRASTPGVARPAQVAEVADVARVARPAEVVPASDAEIRADQAAPNAVDRDARLSDLRAIDAKRARTAARAEAARADAEGRLGRTERRPPAPSGDPLRSIRADADVDRVPLERTGHRLEGERHVAERVIPEAERRARRVERTGPTASPVESTPAEGPESTSPERRRPAAVEGPATERAERTERTVPIPADGASSSSVAPSRAAAATEPLTSLQSADRVQQIQDLQDARPSGQLQQITVHMDDADGEAGMMRVRLDGGRVDATVGLRDLQQAGRLQSRIGDLQQSLRLQGLEPGALQAHAIGSVLDPAGAVEQVAQRAATRWWTGGDPGQESNNPNHEPRHQRDPEGSAGERGNEGSREERRGGQRR
jgi:hypothetical protein